MDWNSIMTLINGADTLLGIAILVVAARYGLRALRSLWRRRSEPRLSLHEWHQQQGYAWSSLCLVCDPITTTTTVECNPQPTSQPPSETLDDHSAGEPMFEGNPPPWYFKNPQATSQPQSSRTTGLTAGQLEQLGAKVDTDPDTRPKLGDAD